MRPDVRSFPPADQAFAREVRRCLAAGGAASPGELERILRPQFPRVVVRARVLSGETRSTWYAFRDGRVT